MCDVCVLLCIFMYMCIWVLDLYFSKLWFFCLQCDYVLSMPMNLRMTYKRQCEEMP